MSRKLHIEPKPTRYRGILYRSRLEARFACTLDNCTNVLSFTYEPKEFLLPQKGWTYTPDFKVVFYTDGQKVTMYFEVKPAMISPEYEAVLQLFARRVLDHPIICCVLDYRRGQALAKVYSRTIISPFDLSGPFPDFLAAANIASNYRFDLEG
jgi:hypothetical protein